jgi:hypothetical protein
MRYSKKWVLNTQPVLVAIEMSSNGISYGLTTSLLFIDDDAFYMINLIEEVTNVEE